jgi:hypothetical protein
MEHRLDLRGWNTEEGAGWGSKEPLLTKGTARLRAAP